MAPSKGKGKKNSQNDTERSGGVSWRDASLHGSTLILSMVKEAASLAPFVELKRAATVALLILKTIQAVRENKEAYERLGEDSGGLIVAIWRSYKKAEVPGEWLSAEMREILEDLTNTLEEICSFVQEQLSRNRAIRVIFSKADIVKINEYREHLNYAMQKFELQSHMNINDVLMQLMRKNDQLSEQILHRNEEEDFKRALEVTALEATDREEARIRTENAITVLDRMKQVEIDHQAGDERWHSDELKRIEEETRHRQSELERLRAIEIANRLKKAQDEEIAELRRKIAANEDSQRSTMIQVQSSTKKGNRPRIEDSEEEEWRGTVLVEAATSEEEEEVRQPVRKNSKVKMNPSKSPSRRSVTLDSADDNDENSRSSNSRIKTARRTSSKTFRVQETEEGSTDEDLRSLRSSKVKTARQKSSKASLRVEESEEEFTDDDYEPPPPRKNPKVNRSSKTKAARREETEDESTYDEEDYVPPPPRKNSKVNGPPRSSSGSPFREVDDLMAQIHGFTASGLGRSGSNSRPRSPMYPPQYGSPFSPPYGYGIGVPGAIVNSGVGNITNTTISNVYGLRTVVDMDLIEPPRSNR